MSKGDHTVITKRRFKVNLSVDPVVIPVTNGNRYIFLDPFGDNFGHTTLKKIRNYIGFLLERQSAESVICFVDGMGMLVSAQVEDDGNIITDGLLRRFKIIADKVPNKHLGRKVRQWLLWDIRTSNTPILTLDQLAFVRKWKFKNPRPYAAIREGKKGVGPIPRRDDLSLRAELKCPANGEKLYGQQTDHQIRTIISLMRRLGLRPTQLCYTKVEDLKVWEYGGRRIGFLMVPDVKDGEAPRAHLTKRRLPDELLDMVERAIADRSSDAIGDWLFPRREPLHTVPKESPPEERWRMRSVDQAISSWIKSRGVTSADGEPLKANPRRLRYTFGTELAPRTSPVELAYALGHKDERSVMHYFTYGDDFFARLSNVDGATKWGLAAASFAGLIVERRPSARDGGPIVFGAELHIGDTAILGIGRCGASVRCRLYPPLSCYGCIRFRPDPDADHASVLQALVTWRDTRPTKVGKIKDPLQGQLDDVIEAAGYLVGILPAFHWTRDRRRNALSRPSIEEISAATSVSVEVLATDRSINALLQSWPDEMRGAGRIAARKKKHG